MISVLVVDDVDDVRLLTRRILEREPDIEVVGEATNGVEAIRVAAHVNPDVVLLDLAMPVMDGLEALPHIRAAAPDARVVIFSGFLQAAMADEARSRGASGYLQKGCGPTELVAGVRAALAGVQVPPTAAPQTRIDAFDDLEGLVETREPLARETVAGDGSDARRDVPAVRTREDDTARLAAALEHANEDLSRFAAVAAHDLRSPVAVIKGLADMLLEPETGPLSDEQRDVVTRIAAGAERLQRLIDDLLTYTRVGATAVRAEEIDVATLVDDALDAVRDAVDSSGAVVEIGPMPTVVGSRTLLGLVFQNLLANAVKFVAPGVTPHVRVEAERDGTEWRFAVIDNGIGVPDAQRGVVFEMFTRLHDRTSYEGTGIGLAICKRAVESHGGRIWVEDAPGGGSRFCFTLP